MVDPEIIREWLQRTDDDFEFAILPQSAFYIAIECEIRVSAYETNEAL